MSPAAALTLPRWCWLAAAALGACTAPVGPDDVAVDAHTRYVHDGQVETRALPELDLVAWVPTAEGWAERAPEKRDNGYFFFPDVPHGRYFVRRGNVFYDTDARALTLRTPVLGQPSRGLPSRAKLTLEAKNARSYQGPATVCLTSVRAGLSGLCSGWREDPYQELLALALELPRAARDLPNADVIHQGDDVLVHQLDLTSYRNGPVGAIYAAARAFSSWTFDMTADPSAEAPVLAGAMYELLPYPFNYAYDRASFEALAPEVHPLARVVAHQPAIEGAVITPDGPRLLGRAPLLFAAVLDPGPAPLLIPTTYGNPLGRSWERFVRATTLYARGYTLPDGAAAPHTVIAGAELGELDALDLPSLCAAMSPPREISIDAQPFADDVTLSAAPALAWSTPHTGTVTSYELRLHELTDEGGFLRSRQVASFFTRQTSLQLPDGVLFRGHHYYAILIARSGDAVSVESGLGHSVRRFPFASAPALSGLLTVP